MIQENNNKIKKDDYIIKNSLFKEFGKNIVDFTESDWIRLSNGLEKNRIQGLNIGINPVDYLIKNSDLKQVDKNGLNALMLIVNYNKKYGLNINNQQLDYLIKNSDLKQVDKSGLNALMLIVGHNKEYGLNINNQQLDYLIKNSDLKQVSDTGFNALMIMVKYNSMYKININNVQLYYLIKNSDLKQVEINDNDSLWYILNYGEEQKLTISRELIDNIISNSDVFLDIKKIKKLIDVMGTKLFLDCVPDEVKEILNIKTEEDVRMFQEGKNALIRVFKYTQYNELTNKESEKISENLKNYVESKKIILNEENKLQMSIELQNIVNCLILPFNSSKKVENMFEDLKVLIKEIGVELKSLYLGKDRLVFTEEEFQIEKQKVENRLKMNIDLFEIEITNNIGIAQDRKKTEDKKVFFEKTKVSLDRALILEKIEFSFEKIQTDVVNANNPQLSDYVVKEFLVLANKNKELFDFKKILESLEQLKERKNAGLNKSQTLTIQTFLYKDIPNIIGLYKNLTELINLSNMETINQMKNKIQKTINELVPDESTYSQKFEEFREKEKEKILTRIRENQSGKIEVKKNEYKI